LSANVKTLRGYVAPFNSVGVVDGGYEKFAPSAFAGMVAAMPPISLRWASHSDGAARLANTTAGTLSLFVDEYGLGFEALLNMDDSENWNRLRHITRRQDPMAFASVGGLVIKGQR
jgi:phage head maturation protease